jgi:hypothetical protein
MTSHDAHFKQLLRTFFREFLEAFVPELGRDLKPGLIEFLDKELVRRKGRALRARLVDLVAKVPFRDQPGFVLVHVEHQAQRQAETRRRLFFYAVWLMEQYGLPVYPILLASYDRPRAPEPDRFVLDVRGLRVVDFRNFRFRVVQLNRLNWRAFLRMKNPAATALMAKMNIAPAERGRVRRQILRLLLEMQLDREKMDLIAGFVSTYLQLTAKEFLAFEREVAQIEERKLKRKAMELMTEWHRQGRKAGREEGELAIVLRLLRRRFGPLPAGLPKQISALPLSQVEALADALLDFASLEDLRRWLERAAR